MNLLKSETSPYLRQHMDNPVEWMPWGTEAFERAKQEDKPVLLSIGYSACHWCHVMAHESFEDPETAEMMNRNFINIKLDREERPDVDLVYQAALSLMNNTGGWPLTMFLLPDGKPFGGGTYFPPVDRHGLPAFRNFLQAVIERYDNKDMLLTSSRDLFHSLNKINNPRSGFVINQKKLDDAGKHFLSLIDPAHGGIGSAPKFPCLGIMSFLWQNYLRTGNDACKFAVIHSLTQMCQGGIYDHLGGGFSRYTVDNEWLVPHFEKMLYDNAQFITLLSEVYKETKNPLFGERITETVEWVRHDLAIRNLSTTAFAASLDADSEGKEGKFYTWTAAEIDAVLGKDSETFKKAYDVTLGGNWEGVNILNRLKNSAYGAAETEAQLKVMREKLNAARAKRIMPSLDNKVLADCNGLMIAGLARAGFALDCQEWVDAAESAFRFVCTYMADKDGRLYHTWCDGKARHEALLDDYANMSDAALALYDVTQNNDYLTRVMDWAALLDREFRDTEKGAYFMSSSLVKDVMIRPKPARDGISGPAGNGTMIGVFTRLHQLTGNQLYAERARESTTTFSGELDQHVLPFSTLLINSTLLLNPVSVIFLEGSGDVREFKNVLRRLSLPGLVTMTFPSGKILPKDHPAFGKNTVDGKTTAYVCFGQQCLPPVTTPATLEDLLKHVRSRPAANDL